MRGAETPIPSGGWASFVGGPGVEARCPGTVDWGSTGVCNQKVCDVPTRVIVQVRMDTGQELPPATIRTKCLRCKGLQQIQVLVAIAELVA